jgi:hypothetical protein
MAAKILWGWGGVSIAYGSIQATFTTSFGVLWFELSEVVNTTKTGDELPHFKGERPIIELELFNTADTDYIQWQNLAAIISASRIDNQPLTIYPRYTAADPGSLLNYSVRCASNFKPDDVGSKGNLQQISLTFRGKSLIQLLPTSVSNPVLALRTCDDSDDTNIRVTDDTDSNQQRVSCKG